MQSTPGRNSPKRVGAGGAPPAVSAAGVKRLMKYKAIDHRAHPASPTWRRSRGSVSMRTATSTQELDVISPRSQTAHEMTATLSRLSLEQHTPDTAHTTGGTVEVPAVLLEIDFQDEIVKDFYESELLLYRNFGADQETDDQLQQAAAPPMLDVRSRSRDGSASDGDVLSPNRDRSRRRSTTVQTLSPPNADGQLADNSSFASERRSAMRRRGSSVDAPTDREGRDTRESRRSPIRGAREASPSSSAPSGVFQVNPSFTAFGDGGSMTSPPPEPATNANPDAPIFELVVPPAGPGSSCSGSASASPTGPRGRQNSDPTRLLPTAGLAPPNTRRRSLRGSWSEMPSGAPRAMTSSARRVVKGISIVDMEQEFTRYSESAKPAEEDGACGCDEATIGRHIGKIPLEQVDYGTMMDQCVWCRRRPAWFLCLACGRSLCPSHVRAHAQDGGANSECTLYVNMMDITTSYDKIYWCERCTTFTFKYTDPYCAIADALVNTRKTYLPAPATDIFLRHYQIRDRAKPSIAYTETVSGHHADEAPALSMKLIASAASMQGWRSTQEDSEVVFCFTPSSMGIDVSQYPDPSIFDAFEAVNAFCIFDGHGGDAVAKIAAHQIEEHLRIALYAEVAALEHPLSAEEREALYQRVLTKALVDLDAAIEGTDDGMNGYYGCVGCTALVVLITPADVVCASLGDSRACLYDVHRARTVPLSVDHTLDNEEEAERVKEAGYSIADGRIEGQLAVPRALGDFDFKQCGGKGPEGQAVSCVPRVTVVDRATLVLGDGEEPRSTAARLPPMRSTSSSPTKTGKAAMPEDWFVVLACDGIWDVLSNDDCCTLLNEHYQQQKRDKQLEAYVQGASAALGYNPGSPKSDSGRAPTRADSPPRGRSRPGSLRGGQHHPANNVVLFANTLNDIVATSVCAAMKRCLALKKDEDNPAGLDNMSLVIARLCMTA